MLLYSSKYPEEKNIITTKILSSTDVFSIYNINNNKK